MENRVKVGIRVRPLVPSEQTDNGIAVVRESYLSGQQQHGLPATFVTVDTTAAAAGNSQVPLKKVTYEYDWVFGPSTSQQAVYSALCEPLVSKTFEGFNATVFAYGQTGSGKTFTMGNCSATQYGEGIITMAMRDMFLKQEQIKAADSSNTVEIELSYLEVYMEECFDLLTHSNGGTERPRLELRESAKGETYVENLSQKSVKCVQEVAAFLSEAAVNRSTGKTAMNSHSSRSHSICTLHVKVVCPNEGTATSSKLHLVDLAGSERVKKTLSTGEVFNEGVSINKGLFALGNVVSALAKSGPQAMDTGNGNCNSNSFVPYRESKLTRLLKDSLGGNGLTVMLACVSPADSNVDETLNTLRFASRASSIVNNVRVNHDEADDAQLVSDNATLRKEVGILKQQLDILKMKCDLLSSVSSRDHSAPFHNMDMDGHGVRVGIGGKSDNRGLPTSSLIQMTHALTASMKKLLVHCLGEEVELDEDLVTKLRSDVAAAGKLLDTFSSTSIITGSDRALSCGCENDVNIAAELGLPPIVLLIDTISSIQKAIGKYDKVSGEYMTLSHDDAGECDGGDFNRFGTRMRMTLDGGNSGLILAGSSSFDSLGTVASNALCMEYDDKPDGDECVLSSLISNNNNINPNNSNNNYHQRMYEKHIERIADDEARVEEDILWKQNEIVKIIALTEKFETTISQLKNEISTLQHDKSSLQQAMTTTSTTSCHSSRLDARSNHATGVLDETRIKKELKEKSRLLEEKLKELKVKESEYNRVQLQRATFSKEAEILRRDLEDSKRKRADLMRKMKEESALHQAERQKLHHLEVNSKKREIKALSSMSDLKIEYELKEKVWKGQLAAKERENKQLQELIDKQSKVKQYKDTKESMKMNGGGGGSGGGGSGALGSGLSLLSGISGLKTHDLLPLQKAAELKVWISELTEAQTLRLSLQEEIQRLVDQRSKVARRLQSLRSQKASSDLAGLTGASGGGASDNIETIISNANASVSNLSQATIEIKALEEDVRKRSVEISQKQKELDDLGKENEKKRFGNITDMKESKFVMEWMFDKITKNSSTHQKSLELKIRSQSDQIDYLKRVISHNSSSSINNNNFYNNSNINNNSLSNINSSHSQLQILKKRPLTNPGTTYVAGSSSSENMFTGNSNSNASSKAIGGRSNIPHGSKLLQPRQPLRPVTNNGATQNNAFMSGHLSASATPAKHKKNPLLAFKSPAVNPFLDLGLNNSSSEPESCLKSDNESRGRISNGSNSYCEEDMTQYPLDVSLDQGRHSGEEESHAEDAVSHDDDNVNEDDEEELDETFYEDDDEDEDYDPEEDLRFGRGLQRGGGVSNKRSRSADSSTNLPAKLGVVAESDPSTTLLPLSKRFASVKNVEKMLAGVLEGTQSLLSFNPISNPGATLSSSSSITSFVDEQKSSNYRKCTVKELKALLAQRNLPVMGLKEDLVARIEQFEALASASRESSDGDCDTASVACITGGGMGMSTGAMGNVNPFLNVLLST